MKTSKKKIALRPVDAYEIAMNETRLLREKLLKVQQERMEDLEAMQITVFLLENALDLIELQGAFLNEIAQDVRP